MTKTGYILIALSVFAAFIIVLYNRLVALRQKTKNALSDIDVQMKQRHDLIPNLVETVKGYTTHEKDVFENVTKARATAMHAQTVNEKDHAESALTGALINLMAVAENYPQLKANENFLNLQSELSDIENKIAAARRFFNNAVTEYNTAIEQFPAVLLAKTFGFFETDMFTLGPDRAAVEKPPAVKF